MVCNYRNYSVDQWFLQAPNYLTETEVKTQSSSFKTQSSEEIACKRISLLSMIKISEQIHLRENLVECLRD